MLEAMPLRLFYDWADYYERNSFGDELTNYWQSIIASLIYNAHRGKGKKYREPKDFLPKLQKYKKKQTPKEMNAIFKLFAQSHNAAEKNKKHGNHRTAKRKHKRSHR